LRSLSGLPGRAGTRRASAAVRLGRVFRAEAEELHRVVDRREAGLGRDLFRPLLDDPALHLDAAAAHPAGQVVMVRGGAALPVEDLTRRVADGVDGTLLAEDLQVAVDSGEPDRLTPAAQLGVDFLGAAETRQAGQRRGDG